MVIGKPALRLLSVVPLLAWTTSAGAGGVAASDVMRIDHTADPVSDGTILIQGYHESSERVDPRSGKSVLHEKWSGCPDNFRAHETVNAGTDRLLIIGGFCGLPRSGLSFRAEGSEEAKYLDRWGVQDTTTGAITWNPLPIAPRYGHTVTRLDANHWIVAGGRNASSTLGDTALVSRPRSKLDTLLEKTRLAPFLAKEERFQWAPHAVLEEPRFGHAALALPDGRVLVLGGRSGRKESPGPHFDALSSAEILSPRTRRWTTIAPMKGGRFGMTATLLASGKVFVVGGGFSEESTRSTELWDPATGRWSAGPGLAYGRVFHTATTLPDGRVLILGGNEHKRSEIYDPVANRIAPGGELATPRFNHVSLLLPDGRMMLSGGRRSPRSEHGELGVELIPVVGLTSVPKAALVFPRESHASVALSDTEILSAGGLVDGRSSASVEIWNRKTKASRVAAPLRHPRHGHSAFLVADGKVVVVGGLSRVVDGGPEGFPPAEMWDPVKGTWADIPEATFPSARVAPLCQRADSTLIFAKQDGVKTRLLLLDARTGRTQQFATLNLALEPGAVLCLPDGKIILAGGRVRETIATDSEGTDPSTWTYVPFGEPVPNAGISILDPNGSVLAEVRVPLGSEDADEVSGRRAAWLINPDALALADVDATGRERLRVLDIRTRRVHPVALPEGSTFLDRDAVRSDVVWLRKGDYAPPEAHRLVPDARGATLVRFGERKREIPGGASVVALKSRLYFLGGRGPYGIGLGSIASGPANALACCRPTPP